MTLETNANLIPAGQSVPQLSRARNPHPHSPSIPQEAAFRPNPTQLQMKDPNVYPSTMKIFHSTVNCGYADTQGTEEKLFISKGIIHQLRFGMVYKQQLQLIRDATDARNKEWVISKQLSDTKINVGLVCLPSPSLMFKGGTGWSPAQILIQLFLSFLSAN